MNTVIVGGEAGLARSVARSFAASGSSSRLADTDADTDADINPLPEAFAGVEALVLLSGLEAGAGRTGGERLERAARGTYAALRAALSEPSLRLVYIASHLRLFARHPPSWNVTPVWRPAPDTIPDDLVPYLAEISAREAARTRPDVRTVCVRFGDDLLAETGRVGDFLASAARTPGETGRSGTPFWTVLHAGSRPAAAPTFAPGFAPDLVPWKVVLSPQSPIPSRPIRRVVLFGAGGPVGAAAAAELAGAGYQLRLTDARPLADIARENEPQFPGAPVAHPLPAPHETGVVDVRDADAVAQACIGMDAVVNLSVLRADPARVFHINTVGAYHICQAAVRCGIRRVVQTGPQQATLDASVGYWGDYGLTGDAPSRPGLHLYAHSKYLGQEVCRVFAERHGLEIPCLLFDVFVNPDRSGALYPFSITFADAGRALRAALEVPSLPSPYEEMNLCADVPHGVFSPRRAREVLGFVPSDAMMPLWTNADAALPAHKGEE